MESRRPSLPHRILCAAWLWFVLLIPAGAQQAADPQQTAAALSRAQGLLRQIGQQKAQLEIENAKIKAANAGLEKKLKSAQARLDDTAADLESSQRQHARTEVLLERTRARLDKTTERLREFVEKYKTTAQSLAETKFEKQSVESELETTQGELADAEEKNLALYKSNREILDLYNNKSGWDGFLQKEPFTGIKDVQIENVVEQYEYEMYDQLRDGNLDAARAIP